MSGENLTPRAQAVKDAVADYLANHRHDCKNAPGWPWRTKTQEYRLLAMKERVCDLPRRGRRRAEAERTANDGE